MPAIIALAALLGGVSCAGVTRFVDPDADLPFYEKVAVIPFNSLAQDRAAGEKVTSIFYSELLTRGFAQVLEPGQFEAGLLQVRGGTPFTNPWSAEELAKVGSQLGVQGVFMGTVRDYDMRAAGRDQFPLISLEVRLVDTASGRVVWSASLTRRGGPAAPFFGWSEVHTLGELTAKVCRRLLQTLPGRG